MREYIALATNLNFTLTAEQLYIEQSTLSRHLMKIEEELGAKLLTRSTHDVELTEKGKRVYHEFKKLVTAYDDLANEISGASNRKLKFGALYYAIDKIVTPILQDFKIKYPTHEIVFSSHQPLQIINELLSDGVDVGLLEAGETTMNHSLKLQTIAKEKLALMICQKHPFARKKKVSIRELSGQTFVFMKNNSWINERILQYLSDFGLERYDIQYSDHVDTLAVTLLETNGIAIVSQHLEVLKRSNITMTALDEELFIDICLAYKKDNTNPNIKLLVNRARTLFRR
jgi:DNA-binding transcriptional LysR family regulator